MSITYMLFYLLKKGDAIMEVKKMNKILTHKGVEFIHLSILCFLENRSTEWTSQSEISKGIGLNQYEHECWMTKGCLDYLKNTEGYVEKNENESKNNKSKWKITEKGLKFLSKQVETKKERRRIMENPLNGFLEEDIEKQNEIIEAYMHTFEDRGMASDYKSYINHFLAEAGQERRGWQKRHIECIGHKSKQSPSDAVIKRYSDDIEDFVLFYDSYKEPSNEIKQHAFKKAKQKRRYFKKAM